MLYENLQTFPLVTYLCNILRSSHFTSREYLTQSVVPFLLPGTPIVFNVSYFHMPITKVHPFGWSDCVNPNPVSIQDRLRDCYGRSFHYEVEICIKCALKVYSQLPSPTKRVQRIMLMTSSQALVFFSYTRKSGTRKYYTRTKKCWRTKYNLLSLHFHFCCTSTVRTKKYKKAVLLTTEITTFYTPSVSKKSLCPPPTRNYGPFLARGNFLCCSICDRSYDDCRYFRFLVVAF